MTETEYEQINNSDDEKDPHVKTKRKESFKRRGRGSSFTMKLKRKSKKLPNPTSKEEGDISSKWTLPDSPRTDSSNPTTPREKMSPNNYSENDHLKYIIKNIEHLRRTEAKWHDSAQHNFQILYDQMKKNIRKIESTEQKVDLLTPKKNSCCNLF